jgi:hypothetical protein
MQPHTAVNTIEIRYSTAYSVTITCLGGVLLASGFLNLMSGTGAWIAFVIAGVLWTIIGVSSFTKSYASFNPANGALTVNALIGSLSRVHGTPKGEQLVSDGRSVFRVAQDGRRRRVAMMGTDSTSRASLIAVLPRVG